MITDNYRKNLLETVNSLIVTQDELFTQALNIEMSGNLKDVNNLFDDGEEVYFRMSDLKKSEDPCVKKLIRLITSIRNTVEFICATHSIEAKELDIKD